MAVKTKRSSVRTALLASASLAALAQGANAAIGFTAEPSAGTNAGSHAFANGVTPACAELIFLKSTGAFVDYKTFADATDKTLYAKGRAAQTAAAASAGTEAQFDHCETDAGYYLHTKATSTTDGTNLRIEQAPAGWYAAGGDVLNVATNAKAKLASELTVAADGTATSITACAAGKFNPFPLKSASADCKVCQAGSFSAAGASSCSACPEGTTNTAGDAFCGDLVAGYYGDVTTGATAHTTATKCPAGTTSAGSSTVGTGYKCARIMENYYGTVGTATAGGTHATVAACPTGTISAGYNSAGTFYCDGIAEGYYGMLGDDAADGYHAVVTACPEGSTSDGTAVAGTAGTLTDINDCDTKPGYYLSTAGIAAGGTNDGDNVAGTITKVSAGFYATGGVAIDSSGANVLGDTSVLLPGDFDGTANVGKCPANSNSEAGASFCVCNAGYAPVYVQSGNDIRVTECAPISGYVAAAAASPTAASPTADSAGASTPIAVALAAAAAVPLLL